MNRIALAAAAFVIVAAGSVSRVVAQSPTSVPQHVQVNQMAAGPHHKVEARCTCDRGVAQAMVRVYENKATWVGASNLPASLMKTPLASTPRAARSDSPVASPLDG